METWPPKFCLDVGFGRVAAEAEFFFLTNVKMMPIIVAKISTSTSSKLFTEIVHWSANSGSWHALR
jgi:hypothetical protein